MIDRRRIEATDDGAIEKKKRRQAVAEFVVVVLVTAVVFVLGREAALKKRGYNAVGGEYLLILLPLFYYVGKSMRLKK